MRLETNFNKLIWKMLIFDVWIDELKFFMILREINN